MHWHWMFTHPHCLAGYADSKQLRELLKLFAQLTSLFFYWYTMSHGIHINNTFLSLRWELANILTANRSLLDARLFLHWHTSPLAHQGITHSVSDTCILLQTDTEVTSAEWFDILFPTKQETSKCTNGTGSASMRRCGVYSLQVRHTHDLSGLVYHEDHLQPVYLLVCLALFSSVRLCIC